jgi:4-amino-4-deoxy-L-arabinose transferase-like glycosyltransferase
MNQDVAAFSSTAIHADEETQTRKILGFFCLIHLIMWTILSGIMIHNPPADSLEGLAWGQLWLFGYPKHPFLAPWLTAFFVHLFHNVDWTIYFIAQLSCILCFWGVWRLAHQLLSPRQALVAVMILSGVHYYNISGYIFNPNVLMLPLWAWLTYFFYQAVQRQHLSDWLLVGVFSGLALLGKYESGLLIILLFTLLLTSPAGRASWKSPGLYLAAALGLLVFSPNLYYLWQHQFNAIHYAVGEMAKTPIGFWHDLFLRFQRPIIFLVVHILYLLPWLILYVPFHQHCLPNRLQNFSLFQRQFLLMVGLGPVIVTVVAAMFMNAGLIQRWGFPFFCFTGILLMAWLNPQIHTHRLMVFLKIWAIFLILQAAAFVSIVALQPYFAKPSPNPHNNFPGRQVSAAILTQWHQYYPQPLVYVGGGLQFVVNAIAFAPTKIIPFINSDIRLSPWIDLASLKQKGAVFVYPLQNERDQSGIDALKSRFPAITHETVIETAPLTRAKVLTVKYWIGLLPPEA